MITATFTPLQPGTNFAPLALIYKKKGNYWTTRSMATEAEYNALLELYYTTPASRA